MKYAHIVDGKIEGWTRWPNDTSASPIDEKSKEWKDFEKAQKDKEDKRGRHSHITLANLLDELEDRFPGFIQSVTDRG